MKRLNIKNAETMIDISDSATRIYIYANLDDQDGDVLKQLGRGNCDSAYGCRLTYQGIENGTTSIYVMLWLSGILTGDSMEIHDFRHSREEDTGA